MHGQVFEAELEPPWPERIMGQDIHRSLVGTYEIVREREVGDRDDTLIYRLREDDDYVRLLNSVALRRVH